MKNGRKNSFFGLLAAFLFLAGTFFIPFSSKALGLSSVTTQPFGGNITVMLPCPCNVSTFLTIGPPRPGVFLVKPTTKIYNNFRIIVGAKVLGLASRKPEPCLIPAPPPAPGCVPYAFGLPIKIIGTN